MKFTVLTLFPEIVDAYFTSSIMAKAIERGVIQYASVNIRDFAEDKHHKCDDAPYGGGAGMLMLPDPLGKSLRFAGAAARTAKTLPENLGRSFPLVVYLTPSGEPFTQGLAKELAGAEELILLCGRYEGIDQRIIDTYVDREISLGDYVLSSGEVAALVVADATYRLIEGVITPESLEEESFSDGLLEYPQYTRPEIYDNLRIPDVLISGHHEHIRRWRLRKRVEKTFRFRPDLIQKGCGTGIFSPETVGIIQELQNSIDTGSQGDGYE